MLLVFFFCANFSEMETRFGKKTRDGGVQDAVEEVQEVVEEAFVDKPQDLELASVGRKPKKQMKYSPRKLWSPTGAVELTKLKQQAKMDRQKIDHLEDRIKYLEEANRELKKDKDFLLTQIKEATVAPASSSKSGSREIAQVPLSSTSTTPSSSSTDLSSSSSSEEEEKKKKKKKTKKSKKHSDSYSRSRMTTVDGVINRYESALKRFTKFGSMKKAFNKIKVDRNTIARTAVIAELAITFPDTFKELLPGNHNNEKISQFAERCRNAITKEMAETITAKKRSGKLLPIMYKYT
ncbi:coiled-coil domain-containing protein 106-like isoform X1 [Fundulus heteroclitus]|uniref:coiled-coil domain-containing protein 106-like isoform X1 n=2 Tax=Fundulus heteroclitus TaxID=8078 RepID=UPI00165B0911|nr:coiled-coil domain-containing protein 106-like isoform X1 [Fundulus heteroclitus]